VDPVFGEVLTTTTRGLLSANTGLGKTMFSMDAFLHSAAGKDFLHWRCPRPCRVLYIDGEMSRRLLQHRIAEATRRLGAEPPGFFVFNREDILGFAPLNTKEGQAAIWKLIEEVERRAADPLDLIIFDNIMSLIVGDMKEEDSWRDTQPLILELTRRRIGQLWIHHTGHDASRGYGTKTREWNLDVVMHMDKADRPDTDVSFKLSFTKARERSPQNREDFAEVKLSLVADQWESQVTAGVKTEKVSPLGSKFLEALRIAAANSAVAHIGGFPSATRDEWLAACKGMGLFDPDEKDNVVRAKLSKYRSELIGANKIAANEEVLWILP
jgi:hypothetical protein